MLLSGIVQVKDKIIEIRLYSCYKNYETTIIHIDFNFNYRRLSKN